MIQEHWLTSQDYLNEYWEKHQRNDTFKHMLEQRSHLPVFQYKSALIEAVKRNWLQKNYSGLEKQKRLCDLLC